MLQFCHMPESTSNFSWSTKMDPVVCQMGLYILSLLVKEPIRLVTVPLSRAVMLRIWIGPTTSVNSLGACTKMFKFAFLPRHRRGGYDIATSNITAGEYPGRQQGARWSQSKSDPPSRLAGRTAILRTHSEYRIRLEPIPACTADVNAADWYFSSCCVFRCLLSKPVGWAVAVME